MPLVSVLMPMKNTARYVDAAVRSILEQSFRDLELIIVDDGSTDGSAEVVARVVAQLADTRVRVLAGPRRGISAAWNHAWAECTGDVVMSCDSDDLYVPGRIAHQVELLQARPELGAVCAPFSTIEPSGRKVADLWAPDAHAEDITKELLAGATRTTLCTFAVRRRHVEQLGGKRTYFESAEDIDMQLRLAEVGRVWFEPIGAYLYRLHGTSITHTSPSARVKFYESYARELAAQRRSTGTDDVERGAPRAPPDAAPAANSHVLQMQGMLIGRAWDEHRRGLKLKALGLGLRALSHAPLSFSTWKSVLALCVKRS